MPDEFAFSQISEFVNSYEKALISNAQIYLRDGLPVLKLHDGNGYEQCKVNGYLLYPKAGQDLARIVQNYEGTNYRKVETKVVLGESVEIECQTFIGSKVDQSNPEPWDGDWSSAATPLIGYGFPALINQLRIENNNLPMDLNPGNYWTNEIYWSGKENWVGMLRLEGDYLTLCSILEYLLTLKFGRLHSNNVEAKIRAIATDKDMLRAFELIEVNPNWSVRDVTNVGAGKSAPINLQKALDAIYRTRSNLTHRGKSGMNDAHTLFKAAELLAVLLVNYLLIAIPKVKDIWPNEMILKYQSNNV